jgi:hypothetical protein
MQSTHTGTVEILSGVPPLLDLSFSYLSQKFLVYSYARSDDALRGGLKTLAALASDNNMIGYPVIAGIEPDRSYSEYSSRALLCVPKVVDDMRRDMLTFLMISTRLPIFHNF